MAWPASVPAAFLVKPLILCFSAGLLLAACQPRPGMAQMSMAGHAMETEDELPPGKLPPPQKMAGIGNVSMQITATPEAQMWFNQGLNLLHDFWDYESARAFEQSIRADPQCAMCYWGLYEAESFYHGTGQGYAGQALNKAVSLKRRASRRERLYIEATAASENAAKIGGEHGKPPETEIWRKLVKQYPKDTEARIFLALSLEDGFDSRGDPQPGQREAIAILQSVLKEDPDNSAVNHYYIHALEAGAHPEQALHSAEILASLAPASGHMVHMPGHIFYRIGDYARAEQAFAASMQVDERYMREQHVQPDNDWNYVHNLMYAIANLMEEGKLKKATALSMKLNGARGELASTLYIFSTRDSITRLDPRLPIALRTGDWARILELLQTSAPPAGEPDLDFLHRQLATYAAGMQAVESHDLSKAEQSSDRFDAELWRKSQQLKNASNMQVTAEQANSSKNPLKLQIMPDALLEPLVRSMSIMSLELRGSLLTAQGRITEAKDAFAKAAQDEKELGYREPPGYIRPVAETEAAALMSVGDWRDAKAAYQQALLERPRSGFPLYGIALSSEKAGDNRAAAGEYAVFLAAWKDADAGLTQVTHAQAYLSGHPPLGGDSEPVESSKLRLPASTLGGGDEIPWSIFAFGIDQKAALSRSHQLTVKAKML